MKILENINAGEYLFVFALFCFKSFLFYGFFYVSSGLADLLGYILHVLNFSCTMLRNRNVIFILMNAFRGLLSETID